MQPPLAVGKNFSNINNPHIEMIRPPVGNQNINPHTDLSIKGKHKHLNAFSQS